MASEKVLPQTLRSIRYIMKLLVVLIKACTLAVSSWIAFNTVNHSILLQKMFGFRGSALSLMKSYLTNRYQYTKIGDSKS